MDDVNFTLPRRGALRRKLGKRRERPALLAFLQLSTERRSARSEILIRTRPKGQAAKNFKMGKNNLWFFSTFKTLNRSFKKTTDTDYKKTLKYQ